MTDVPLQSLRASLRQALEDGDREFIDGLRQDFYDEDKNERFDRAYDEAYEAYQAAHEVPESARVKAAAKLVDAENEAAPSSEEVEALYRAPKIEPILGNDGSTVESIVISRWEVDPETSRPVEVVETTEAPQ